MASSRLWAGLLDRYRGGQPQALLNALLGVATLLPVLSPAWPVTLVSGLMFGAVFLSVVASTTALVRHNLPAAQWAAGISAFTIVFALGQIVGPTVTGWISDGRGGLARGLRRVGRCTLWTGRACWPGVQRARLEACNGLTSAGLRPSSLPAPPGGRRRGHARPAGSGRPARSTPVGLAQLVTVNR